MLTGYRRRCSLRVLIAGDSLLRDHAAPFHSPTWLLLTRILGLSLLVRRRRLDIVPPDLDRGILRSLLLGACSGLYGAAHRRLVETLRNDSSWINARVADPRIIGNTADTERGLVIKVLMILLWLVGVDEVRLGRLLVELLMLLSRRVLLGRTLSDILRMGCCWMEKMAGDVASALRPHLPVRLIQIQTAFAFGALSARCSFLCRLGAGVGAASRLSCRLLLSGRLIAGWCLMGLG